LGYLNTFSNMTKHRNRSSDALFEKFLLLKQMDFGDIQSTT